MRQEPLHLVRIAVIPTLMVVLLALPLPSCLEPTSVDCASGRVCPAGQRCSADGDACIKTDCGDGIVQAQEVCDDGNIRGGDGCNETCNSKEVCGNGVKDESVGEVCDDGDNEREGGCSANCLSFETCGNGNVDPQEQCDSGNETEYCNSNCTVSRCGDGHVNSASLEECDYKNNPIGCNLDCTLSKCGDGIINTADNEECDSGGVDTEYCNYNCKVSRCGDAYVNSAAGEQCDTKLDETCNLNCTSSTCGNGTRDSHEACDDGNRLACGTCNETCNQRQDIKPAKGSIIALPKEALKDGEQIYINDGQKTLTFEFDTDNSGCSDDTLCVDIHNKPNPDEVAATLADEIRDSNLNIQVSSVLWNLIKLEHKAAGTIGNNKITYSVTHDLFKTEGMEGGSGEGCKIGDSCISKIDCEYGLRCEKGHCID